MTRTLTREHVPKPVGRCPRAFLVCVSELRCTNENTRPHRDRGALSTRLTRSRWRVDHMCHIFPPPVAAIRSEAIVSDRRLSREDHQNAWIARPLPSAWGASARRSGVTASQLVRCGYRRCVPLGKGALRPRIHLIGAGKNLDGRTVSLSGRQNRCHRSWSGGPLSRNVRVSGRRPDAKQTGPWRGFAFGVVRRLLAPVRIEEPPIPLADREDIAGSQPWLPRCAAVPSDSWSCSDALSRV